MIWISDIGDLEICNLNIFTIQDKIQLHTWRSTRIGWIIGNIGAAQASSFLEQEYLVLTPERIEITGHYHGFAGLLYEFI